MGDESGFDAYFAMDFPHLVGFLRKHGFDLEIARDAASDAMASAHDSWDTIRFPLAWSRKEALRRASDQVNRVRADAEPAHTSEWAWSAEFSADELDSWLEDTALVVDLLERLPSGQRSAMTWSLDGFSDAEIASILRVREETVRSTLHGARTRLGQIYRESGEAT